MSEVDLSALSAASAMLVETTAARVVRVTAGRRELSGLVWTDDQIVTAEECIADDEGLAVVLADGRSLPAAGGESLEEGVAGGFFAKVERLRVPCRRELDDRICGQVVDIGAELVSDMNVF